MTTERVLLDGSPRGCAWGYDAAHPSHPATGWAANGFGDYWPSCSDHGWEGTYVPGPAPRPASVGTALPHLEPEPEVDWRAISDQLAEAIRLTREYIGEAALPAVEGWSWFDATEAYRAAVRQDGDVQ